MFNYSVILLKEAWSGFHCVRTGAPRRDFFLSSPLSFRRKNSNLHFPPRSFIYSSPGSYIYPTIRQILQPLSSGPFQGHILAGMVKCLLVPCLSQPSLSSKSGLHLCGASPMLSSCQHPLSIFFF